MHIFTVAGFLGSGKPTLVVNLSRHLAGRGRRIAILVNAIGEIDIDDPFMRRLGLGVLPPSSIHGLACRLLRRARQSQPNARWRFSRG